MLTQVLKEPDHFLRSLGEWKLKESTTRRKQLRNISRIKIRILLNSNWNTKVSTKELGLEKEENQLKIAFRKYLLTHKCYFLKMKISPLYHPLTTLIKINSYFKEHENASTRQHCLDLYQIWCLINMHLTKVLICRKTLLLCNLLSVLIFRVRDSKNFKVQSLKLIKGSQISKIPSPDVLSLLQRIEVLSLLSQLRKSKSHNTLRNFRKCHKISSELKSSFKIHQLQRELIIKDSNSSAN